MIKKNNAERNSIADAIIKGEQTPEWTKKIEAYEKKNGKITKEDYASVKKMREIVKKIKPYSSAVGKYQYIYKTLLANVKNGTVKRY